MQFSSLNLPYNPISAFYKQKFGEKVFKVPVSVSEDCPNRMGLNGMSVCIFCDEHGSFAYPENQRENLLQQIKMHKLKVRKRFNANKFLIYFQAYTTTFNQFEKIKQSFAIALEDPDVVGIVVGTRPDCLSDALLKLWKETSEKTFLSIELGAQSFDDKQLEWMKRGHNSAKTIKAIHKIHKHCPKAKLGLHLMFGWPNESIQDVIESARICNALPLNDVKLHNLHVLKNTPLAELFFSGDFNPVDFDEYAKLVGNFLSHLSPQIYVHRLVAIASRWEDLIAPEWTKHKMKSYQEMLTYLKSHDVYQGKEYSVLKNLDLS